MAIWAGIVLAVVGAGISAGVSYAAQPDMPDPAKSSRRTVRASLRALPGQKQLDAAARLGQKVTYRTGQGRKTREADFTGYGDADVQSRLARSMAEIGIDLSEKYGEEFAIEARKQQEQADPEGTAARGLLASKINEMEEARQTRARPVAGALDAQVRGELDLGRRVDPEIRSMLERTIASRGGSSLTGEGVASELESGPAGDERLRARIQKGLSYLGSGASPEDAAYREEQQSMANMASFLGGRTPQSQFASLSGGQQGANPQPRGQSLVGMNPNTQQLGQQAGLQNYQQGVRAAATQVSPWFVGLNAMVQGAGAAGNAGYKPFGQN